MENHCPDQQSLDHIFPAAKTDQFFEALYGEASEGAYDIRLVCHGVGEDRARFAFELNRREGKCLVCSITYGLPEVFQKHPLIDLAGTSRRLADLLGWTGAIEWKLGPVQEVSADQSIIPYILTPAGDSR